MINTAASKQALLNLLRKLSQRKAELRIMIERHDSEIGRDWCISALREAEHEFCNAMDGYLGLAWCFRRPSESLAEALKHQSDQNSTYYSYGYMRHFFDCFAPMIAVGYCIPELKRHPEVDPAVTLRSRHDIRVFEQEVLAGKREDEVL